MLPSSTVNDVRLLHPPTGLVLIRVTDFGMFKAVRLLQPIKGLLYNSSKELGSSIDVRLEQL